MDTLLAFLHSLQGWQAYALLLGLLVGSGFGLPVNEDLLLVGAAALTLKGVMAPGPLIAVAWVGLVTADSLVLHWGHRFGGQWLRHRFMARLMPETRLAAVQALMQRYGPGFMFAARFMPGLRTPLFFAAGSLKMPYRHLLVFDGTAALIELPLLVFGVRYLGGRWEDIVLQVQRFQGFLGPGMLLLVLGLWLYKRWGSARKRLSR